jgi:hypothetical protein
MSSEPVDRLLVPGTASAPGAAPPSPARADASPAFRRLLESLEKLARERPATREVTDADTLQQEIARADDGFRQVMDLRRRLEEAFRSRQ